MQVRFDDIKHAHAKIKSYIHRTPVLTSRILNSIAGARLFFKCENFQKSGAFKFRGAMNAVLSLSEEHARAGVVTHSSGNHAGALALAAKTRNIPAFIVMPENASEVKEAAVRDYGGSIIHCGLTLASREEVADKVLKDSGGTLIHPYNDERIIAGQGTAALELVEEVGTLDAILAPVSGGGLLSGTVLAAKGFDENIRVYGCEPEQADDAYRSFQAGKLIPAESPDTIADGLRASLGDKTFQIIKKEVDGILLVSEQQIIEAMRLIWERMKIIVEPSGAASFAALLLSRPELSGKRIGIILSGGNVDLSSLPF
jgi:threonine dehydratase